MPTTYGLGEWRERTYGAVKKRKGERELKDTASGEGGILGGIGTVGLQPWRIKCLE